MKLMDAVIDIVCDVFSELAYGLTAIFYIVAMLFLTLTIPLWIIPYLIWRGRKGVDLDEM